MSFGNTGAVLKFYSVYHNPTDFPGLYVCRVFENDRPTTEHWTGQTLDEVRRGIPEGTINLGRMPGDDPVIVEAWV